MCFIFTKQKPSKARVIIYACYIFLEREDMDQEVFIKMAHHACALEYLSSYAYENISQKESNAVVTSRASGWLLPRGAGRKTMQGGEAKGGLRPPAVR